MKLLIVSSYKISCGIATYTEALETLLSRNLEVSIAPLDQTVLKSNIPHVAFAGDRLIQEICASFTRYDAVNLQWEPGLFGSNVRHMTRRLEMILKAAPRLILTVHTVVPYPNARGLIPFLRQARLGWRGVANYLFDTEQKHRKETHRILADRIRSNQKTVIAVHTNREREFFRKVVGFPNVYDHPLSLIHADWSSRLAQDVSGAREDLRRMFPGKSNFIGVFGFLSEYKGIRTALEAMKYLPEDFQLLIYGGVHPESLKERKPIDAYVAQLVAQIEADLSSPANRKTQKAESVKDSNPASQEYKEEEGQKGTLLSKVAFLGSPDDYAFALAMCTADVCVFPYLEVGQSGSGPLSMAVELGRPAIASRTKAFVEFERYHPKRLEMIDVGNHIQLAQTILRVVKRPALPPQAEITNESLAEFYTRLTSMVSDCSSEQVDTVSSVARLDQRIAG